MPELPEVEIVKRGLEPAMLNKILHSVTLNRKDLRVPISPHLKSDLEGQKITALQRRGKYILAFNENGDGFVLHLGMSGRIRIYAPNDSYDAVKHDHVLFKMSDGSLVVFHDPRRFGMLYSTTQNDWQRRSPFDVMGPEPMGNEFSGEVLYERLHKRRVAIKNALLNQEIVAGVGNIYACEALFNSGIAPERLASDITKKEAHDLAVSIKDVLGRAIEAGGSTLRDYKQTDGSLGYFQYSFSVYDKEGHSCPSCDCDMIQTNGVKRIVQSGRSTFYCAQKQK